MIKTHGKLGIKGNLLNMIEGNYEKPIGNIMLSGERMTAFLPRSGKRQGCLLSPLLLKIVL